MLKTTNNNESTDTDTDTDDVSMKDINTKTIEAFILNLFQDPYVVSNDLTAIGQIPEQVSGKTAIN